MSGANTANKRRTMKTENLIQEAINQIEHLHEKYGETGSGNQVLAKLKAYKPQPLSDEMREWLEYRAEYSKEARRTLQKANEL